MLKLVFIWVYKFTLPTILNKSYYNVIILGIYLLPRYVKSKFLKKMLKDSCRLNKLTITDKFHILIWK